MCEVFAVSARKEVHVPCPTLSTAQPLPGRQWTVEHVRVLQTTANLLFNRLEQNASRRRVANLMFKNGMPKTARLKEELGANFIVRPQHVKADFL